MSLCDDANDGLFSFPGLQWNAAPSLRNPNGGLYSGYKADDPGQAGLGNDGTRPLCTVQHYSCTMLQPGQSSVEL